MLKEVKNYLKSLNVADSYSVGTIDDSRFKTLGIYADGPAPVVEAFGKNSSYRIANIKLLIHWNKNAVETEQAARNVWSKLENLTDFYIGDIFINYLEVLYGEPVFLGPDSNGVYEYVIDFNLYYRREN